MSTTIKEQDSTAALSAHPSSPIIDHSLRLSRPGPERLAFYFTNAVLAFWVIGFIRTRRLIAHQFLAENAHRLPTNKHGWYLYHRAKLYRVTWRGFLGGWKAALPGGLVALTYGLVEESWDRLVGRVDVLGSVVAGGVTAAGFATVKARGYRQALRYLRVGMGIGLVSGVVQDLVRWGMGAPPWYVQKVKRWRVQGEQSSA